MHFELDTKERPFEDLREVFERLKLDLSNTLEFRRKEGNTHFLRQHRICVSPTMIRYSRG